ncbi:hypothetical protein [Xanthomonas campestris]|uniref:hypothetical protein n=1 Tax=Xanthomonas campestris TaxID=339 RepID=UPI0011C35227|nr:hypothetical protein [Xanthomonas campestris]
MKAAAVAAAFLFSAGRARLEPLLQRAALTADGRGCCNPGVSANGCKPLDQPRLRPRHRQGQLHSDRRRRLPDRFDLVHFANNQSLLATAKSEQRVQYVLDEQ